MRRFLTPTGHPLAAVSTATLLALSTAACSSSAKPDPYKIGALPAAQTVTAAHAAGHWSKDGDDTVRFTGTVTAGSAAEFASALSSSTKNVVATVTGGDLPAGLAIARTLHDRKLALTIDGACAGPCADYWFPAASARKADVGGWLGYTPDLAETAGATAENRAAEAKLYTDSGVDAARFHTALDAELREVPGSSSAPAVPMWMPDHADLLALGYPATALTDVWLPPNLASANAHAHAWGQLVAYKNTLVGLPPIPAAATGTVPAPPAASASASATATNGATPAKH